MAAPSQSRHWHKQGAGRGKSKEMAGKGTGARDVTRLEPRYIFSFFFFLILLIKYINRYYRPWRRWRWPPAHPHHHHTHITSIWQGNMMKGRGGLKTSHVSSPWYVFFFLYYYLYILSMEWAYKWLERDGNGQGSRHNASRAPGMFFCIVFLKLLILFSQIELANRYGRAEWDGNGIG